MKLRRYKAGTLPSPIEANAANEVIDAVETILNGEIIPHDAGRIIASEGKFVIQLNKGKRSEYPWIGYQSNDDTGNYWAWLGAGDASWVDEPAEALDGLNIQVGDWSAWAFSLKVGDATAENDEMLWQRGGHAVGIRPSNLDFDNSKVFVGYDTSVEKPGYKVTLYDGSTHGIGLHPYGLEGDTDKLFFGIGSNNIWHMELKAAQSYIKLGSQGYLGIGDEDGGAWFGFGDGYYHAELPGDGYYTVGDASLKQDSLILSKIGKIYINGAVFDSSQLKFDDGYTYSGKSIAYLGNDGASYSSRVLSTDHTKIADGALWGLISDSVDDSIRAALSTLTATLDCDTKTITFSYSY